MLILNPVLFLHQNGTVSVPILVLIVCTITDNFQKMTKLSVPITALSWYSANNMH